MQKRRPLGDQFLDGNLDFRQLDEFSKSLGLSFEDALGRLAMVFLDTRKTKISGMLINETDQLVRLNGFTNAMIKAGYSSIGETFSIESKEELNG